MKNIRKIIIKGCGSSVEIIGEEDDGGLPDDLSTKKVHLKEQQKASDLSIMVDLDPTPTVTWKDKLLGGSSTKGGLTEILKLGRESDLEFVEGDIKKLDINRTSSIDFFENVNQLLVKDMALTYLTIQPWSTNFDPAKPYLSLVKFWIRLPGLPGHLYNWKILLEIRELVGKVVGLDFNTDNRARGRFARMVVFVNLDKSLISQILINGILQHIEYESLSVVCFTCNRYNHGNELCPTAKMVVVEEGEQSAGVRIGESDAAIESTNREVDSVNYGPWVLVEKKSRKISREDRGFRARNWGIDLVDLISKSYLSREMVKAKGLGRNLRDRG
ncbi:hypothetical protein PVK06_039261 [Gossypium arboreum]|uniref:DUF4283 domain-containing protein n=1 Tax=Gossypium arboreum TaxID=29729 RepID=A0ABR0N2E8_GOSAR|nr:hypothetical protein PVK06_039261 [Gossypium arboreum]